MAPVEVVRTYLEMTSPPRPADRSSFPVGVRLEREACEPGLSRQLYEGVGGRYHWRDRLAWTDEQLRAHLARPGVSTWVLRDAGIPCGFFELATQVDGSVEIAYFGLMPAAIGRGLGRALLTAAIDRAWNREPAPPRIWLHTCTLDHPAALSNYLGRGFRVTHTERYTTDTST
jgi:ribosomal protein S18 acetylase RimI-like enzyme